VTLSCDLWAELVVGLIIRARKPSSAAPLTLDFGLSVTRGIGGLPKAGRSLFKVEAFRRSVAAFSGERVEVLPIDLRLVGADGAVLEADAAVEAVSDTGNFTGRVGDLGFGLTKALLPCGRAGVVFFAAVDA